MVISLNEMKTHSIDERAPLGVVHFTPMNLLKRHIKIGLERELEHHLSHEEYQNCACETSGLVTYFEIPVLRFCLHHE